MMWGKYLPTRTLLQLSFTSIIIILTNDMSIPKSMRMLYKTSILNTGVFEVYNLLKYFAIFH